MTSKIGEILKGGPTNWGKWGTDDEVGAVRYLGPEQVFRGMRCVQTGRVFTLGIALNNKETGDPVAPGRIMPQHFMHRDKSHYECGEGEADWRVRRRRIERGLDADSVTTEPRTSTRWGHVWYDDQLFNGFDAATTKADWIAAALHRSRNTVL